MKKRLFIVLIAVGMVAALSLGVAATVNAQVGKGVELGEAVVITAEVLAIDKEDRILTLLGPKKMSSISRWVKRPVISTRSKSETS